MTFGENLLTRNIVDWVVTNGSISTTSIVLAPNGSAVFNISKDVLSTIPSQLEMQARVSPYADHYVPMSWAKVEIVDIDGMVYLDYAMLVNTSTNICRAVFNTPDIQNHISCTFSFSSKIPITIFEWVLAGPVLSGPTVDIAKELPRMLSYFNRYPITINLNDTLVPTDTVALVTGTLLKNTDVGAKLVIGAEGYGNGAHYTVSIKDNGYEELYSPLHFDPTSINNRGTITIPFAFLKRKAGKHNFSVNVLVENDPTTIFHPRQILFVVEAGGLIYSEFPIGSHIFDVAVYRGPNDTGPSALYAIGRDPDGITRIRKTPYERTSLEAVWEVVYEISDGVLDAAIEFDGTWQRDGDKHVLITEEEPWFFYVYDSRVIWAQHGFSTQRFTLAAQVTRLAAVRGYKSPTDVQNDQGLVVAFLSDELGLNTLMYRTYAWSQSAASYVWDGPYPVDTMPSNGRAVDIDVQRLNDFRLSFVVNYSLYDGMTYDPLPPKWYITDRYYIDSTTPPEYIDLKPSFYMAMSVLTAEDEPVDTSYEAIYGRRPNLLVARYAYPLVLKGDWRNTVTGLINTSGRTIDTMYVNENNSTELFVVMDGDLGSSLQVSMQFAAGTFALVLPTGVEYMLSTVVWAVSPQGFAREFVSLSPNVTLNMKISGSSTLYGYYNENVDIIPVLSTNMAVGAIATIDNQYNESNSVNLHPTLLPNIAVSFVGIEPI